MNRRSNRRTNRLNGLMNGRTDQVTKYILWYREGMTPLMKCAKVGNHFSQFLKFYQFSPLSRVMGYGLRDPRTAQQTDGRTSIQTDQLIDGPTNRWTNRQTDGHSLLLRCVDVKRLQYQCFFFICSPTKID